MDTAPPGARAVPPGPRVPAPPTIDGTDRGTLLRLARATVEAAVSGRPVPSLTEAELTPALRAPGAAFVTIRQSDGELRGCIGNLDDLRPIWANVALAAAGAATRDPRFLPVAPFELPALRLDVSVLGSPVELPDPAAFDPVAHGVIVEREGRRALLLPNVGPPLGWGPRETLDAVCRKAGLPGDAWRWPGTRLRVFATTEFAEQPVA